MSNSQKEKCQFILQKGKNKGKMCGRGVVYVHRSLNLVPSGLCSKHQEAESKKTEKKNKEKLTQREKQIKNAKKYNVNEHGDLYCEEFKMFLSEILEKYKYYREMYRDSPYGSGYTSDVDFGDFEDKKLYPPNN